MRRTAVWRLSVIVASVFFFLWPFSVRAQEPDSEEATILLPGDIPEHQLLLLGGPARYEVIRGEPFQIELFLDQTDPEEVEMTLPDVPEGLEVDDAPLLLSRSEGVVEVRIEARARQAGRYVLEPILFETASGSWYVPRILVEAAPAPGGAVPFGARWRLEADTVYQGQSVPVVLEITNIDSFTYPDSVAVRSPETGLFEEISGIGSVFTDRVAGLELFRIPVAVFLFTPTAAGVAALPPAEVTALGMTAQTSRKSIDVNSVPPVVENTGAVGQFDVTVELDRRILTPGETAEVRIRVDGAGNLPVLDMPSVSVSGLRVVDQSDSGTSVPDTETLLGYRGERVRTIRLEPDGTAQQGMIRVESFAHLDPQSGTVLSTAPRSFDLDLPAEGAQAVADQARPDLDLLSIEDLRQVRWFRVLDLRWPLLLFLIGPGVFSLVRLLSVRRSPEVGKTGYITIVLSLTIAVSGTFFTSFTIVPGLNQERLERAEQLIRDGNHAVAGVLYELELQDHPRHAGLHYNRGVLAIRSDNAFAAVYHLRSAVKLAPGSDRFRRALEEGTSFFGHIDHVPISQLVRPDVLLIVLFLVWTALWSILLTRSALARSIGIVTLFMVIMVVGAGLIWSLNVASQQEGLVQRDVIVRRIPDDSAEPWVQLGPVTSVKIELSYDTFYLVNTASGVTGWIPKKDVRMLGAVR